MAHIDNSKNKATLYISFPIFKSDVVLRNARLILWNDSVAAKIVSKHAQEIQDIDIEIINNKYIWCGTQLF